MDEIKIESHDIRYLMYFISHEIEYCPKHHLIKRIDTRLHSQDSYTKTYSKNIDLIFVNCKSRYKPVKIGEIS